MKNPHRTTMYLDFIHDFGDGTYKLEGYLGGKSVELDDVSLKIAGADIGLEKVERVQSQDGLEMHFPVHDSTFEASFSAGEIKYGKMIAKHQDKKIRIRTNQFTGLADLLFSYKIKGERIFAACNGRIRLYPKSGVRIFWFECLTLLSVAVNWRLPAAMRKLALAEGPNDKMVRVVKGIATVAEAIVTIPKSIILRVAYRLLKTRNKRPIWIVSDRATAAGDNGEALFKFIQVQDDVPADVYFAISRKSSDYARIKTIGKVLDYGSMKHQLFFLLSEKIISSHADTEVINPFFRQVDRYSGLFDFDFIFLQHGVIRHDLSGWLNRFNKNIKLFITSSSVERKSILSLPYYYREEEVLLSGLPRFDYLKDEPKNKLILAPTYRKFLLRGATNKKGERKYDPEFKQSDYFKFYNGFMNDPDVLRELKENGVRGEFYLHPVLKAQACDFKQNEYFKVMDYPYDYSRAFREGNLLISDHSSLVSDFVYLKKPVLYAHFDADKFYAGHMSTKSDFFDDERDGFGVVCHDYEELVEQTILTIKAGFKMPDSFKERVDNYFEYNDHRNSERVYYAILKLGTRSHGTSS